ncbi:MAG: cytochrome c biogenesis protein CcsA [Candidatus Handelsmanbacteria bacterium]|nr:cytochrome c biogenesis protein CcsA [Candidatus Handelsmanbacteria bacterium]
MTAACFTFLGISLLLYLAGALLYLSHFLRRQGTWEEWGGRALSWGLAIHAVGILMHFLFSGLSPFSNLLPVISLLIIAGLATGLVLERRTQIRRLNLLLAPLAFFGLLYLLLMPVRLEGATSVLLHYPWLGVHVGATLLGNVGFALAFASATIYLAQGRLLKMGRLNSLLPALDTAASATYRFAAVGFAFFTLGLGMGILWLFGAPGEYLARSDTKTWMAIPSWAFFAAYLYLRGLRGSHGSRLKWLVIAGFLTAAANLLAVRHHFVDGP